MIVAPGAGLDRPPAAADLRVRVRVTEPGREG
jgi:hypothetical protein